MDIKDIDIDICLYRKPTPFLGCTTITDMTITQKIEVNRKNKQNQSKLKQESVKTKG